jgi:hypothetical protein
MRGGEGGWDFAGLVPPVLLPFASFSKLLIISLLHTFCAKSGPFLEVGLVEGGVGVGG